MRVILITNLHARSDFTAIGGMELAAAEALQALQSNSQNHEIAVVAHPDTVVPQGVTLIPLGLPDCPEEYCAEGDGPRKWFTLATENALYGLSANYVGTADIVHTMGTDAIGSGDLARRLGAKFVRTLHLMPWFPGYAVTANKPDWCVYVSEYQRACDRWRVRPGASVIRDYVPVSCAPIGNRNPWAVTVGRIEPRKGQFEAAAVAESLGCDLVLIGQIMDQNYAASIRERFGDHVRFAGPLDRVTALQQIASAATLIWTPQVREPCGRVVIEALRLGTKVIGNRSGALHDIELEHGNCVRSIKLATTVGLTNLVEADICEGNLWPDSAHQFAASHWQLYEHLCHAIDDDAPRIRAARWTPQCRTELAAPQTLRVLNIGIIDAVIPIADRPEAAIAMFSLLAAGPLIRRIILVDGTKAGQQGPALAALAAKDSRVTSIHTPMLSFSKPTCLNAGLMSSEAPFILMSDADIVWYENTLQEMVEVLGRGRDVTALCSVEQVEETKQSSVSLNRPGYEYKVEAGEDICRVTIRRRVNNPAFRPGPGLVMAPRATWHRLGGYVEEFRGWGWEDQDLLIRAELSNIQHHRVGRVLHLSHGDEKRNMDAGNINPTHTRDANILISARRLVRGELVGSISSKVPDFGKPIDVLFENGVEQELLHL